MSLRPWRKRVDQIITSDKWRNMVGKEEDMPDGQMGEHDSSDSQTNEQDSRDRGTDIQTNTQDCLDNARQTATGQLPQVGGHGAWDKEQQIKVSQGGFVMKPVQSGPRGQREVDFYKNVSTSTDSSVASFNQFIPKFHGVSCDKKEDGSLGQFLVIENLTRNMRLPCIMDIKIGARTWGPDANEKKRRSQDASYAGTKVPLGFSVPGLSVHQTSGETLVHGKEYGRSLTLANIPGLLDTFLVRKERELEVVRTLASLFLQQLTRIQELFSKQEVFHLFGSSLLFVYDAAAVVEFQENGDKSLLEKSVRVKMIDFAHVWPAEGKLDTNYLKGVDSMVQLFTNVL